MLPFWNKNLEYWYNKYQETPFFFQSLSIQYVNRFIETHKFNVILGLF